MLAPRSAFLPQPTCRRFFSRGRGHMLCDDRRATIVGSPHVPSFDPAPRTPCHERGPRLPGVLPSRQVARPRGGRDRRHREPSRDHTGDGARRPSHAHRRRETVRLATQYKLTKENFTKFRAAAESISVLAMRDSSVRNHLRQPITGAGANELDAGLKWLESNPAVSNAIVVNGLSPRD